MGQRNGGRVAIIGAGLIGRAWAAVFARAGWQVRITDPSRDALAEAPRAIRQSLQDLAAFGLASEPDEAAERVSVVRTLAEAVADADLVQENGPEAVEIKRAVFAELDRLSPPGAILASSSATIVASRFTEGLAGRQRCLIAHPLNPPHLVPLVELCGAPWTDPANVERARLLYEEVGQVPIVIRRELDGLVADRLQGALLAEAFRLAGSGSVSPHDLDRTMKDGLGLRWAFMGPLETIELNAPDGIRDYCTRYAAFCRRLTADPPKPDIWDAFNVATILREWGEAPDPDVILAKSAWRDRRLAALRRHKDAQPEAVETQTRARLPKPVTAKPAAVKAAGQPAPRAPKQSQAQPADAKQARAKPDGDVRTSRRARTS